MYIIIHILEKITTYIVHNLQNLIQME